MIIIIPVLKDDGINSKIVSLSQKKLWAYITFNEGEVEKLSFIENRGDIKEWIDFVILENRFENSLDFMNSGMMCLVRREEETLEEILNAFKFKELDEI